MTAPESPSPHILPTIGDEVPRRAWIRFVALLGLLSAVIVVVLVTDLRDQASPEDIRRVLRNAGLWAPALLLAVYAGRPLLLLPISPFWIASGAFFGWLEGAALAILGTALGALIGFHAARHLGRDFVERRLGTRVGRWARKTRENGFRTVFALQLTPIMPHDLLNSMAGVSRMPYRSFAAASLLGTTPIILVYAYIGASVWNVRSLQFWIAVGILLLLTVVMLSWNRIAGRWRSRTPARRGAA